MIVPSREWILGVTLCLLVTLGLGMTLVWLNIERVDMAYGFKELQQELERRESLASKLRVERDNLVAPYRLRNKAAEYGMGPARSGQMRHMFNTRETAQDNDTQEQTQDG